ncbi:hypothetical protein OA410_00560 [Paracoccaceae bacterium]|nr:hypothetical protein [Paracoccaceae bacterium]
MEMSEQAHEITSYTTEKKTTLDYLSLVGGWLVSCFSLVIIGLISYWAIKIPEKNVNNLPIINALKGDIRVVPDDAGGKLFEEEDLSIYKNLESDPKMPEKNEIILNNSNQNLVNLRKEIKVNEFNNGDQKNLTLAIEDALREVVNSNEEKIDEPEATTQQGIVKLYLGAFDTFSEADEFRQFIKRRNDTLLNINNLKVLEQIEGETIFFRVELTNIGSGEEGEKLCSILSSRQFSCLVINDLDSN